MYFMSIVSRALVRPVFSSSFCNETKMKGKVRKNEMEKGRRKREKEN
jgi:hypothetical protein